MDFSTNSTSINMNMYIQPANLPIKDTSDFPSKQAEAIQKHLLELDKQGKLKDEFLSRYGNNLGKPNSLANYILEDFENRKHLFIEWTGIEVNKDKKTIKAIGIKLNEVSKGSGRYFLWKCSTCQYEWVAKIAGRTYTKSGCPKCGYRKRAEALQLQGEPLDAWCNRQGEYGEKIRKEFVGELADGTKISINSISRGSKQEVYWKCSNKDCSYKWKATPNSRTYIKRQGCPACAKIKMAEAAHLKGETLERWCNVNGKYGKQLKEEFIGLDEDNKQIALVDISRGGRQKVWWRCSKCNYEWTAMIADRTNSNKSSGCPACAGNICIPGVNDLETYCHQHPELNYILEEFVGLDKNNQHILPSEVARGSIKKVLFECNKCHKR